MHIERINTDEGLEALLPDWAALWQRLAGATPLWEWIGEDATVFSY